MLLFLGVFGAVRGILANAIAWRHVLLLWLSTSIVGTSVGAYFSRFISNDAQLLLFAGSTIIISWKIFRQSFPEKRASVGGSGVLQCAVHPAPPFSAPPLRENSGTPGIAEARFVTTAVAAGVLCGVIGAGGGFLITPLLCSYGHDLKTAVPTNHTIMFMNAIVGIAWYSHSFELDSACVDTLLIAGMVGCGGLAMYCFEGMHWNALSQQVFAAILFVMGVAIIAVQIAAHA